jgi:hypothetical protein
MELDFNSKYKKIKEEYLTIVTEKNVNYEDYDKSLINMENSHDKKIRVLKL